MSAAPLPLRVARADEAPAIADLVNAAFRVEAFFKRGNRTEAAEVEALMERGEFLVADDLEQDGPGTEPRLAACVYVSVNGDRGYFGMLSLEPRRQGRGLGKALVAEIESRLRARGCRAVDIHVVNLRTELPPFYERLGYVPAGTLPFPDDGSSTQPCHFVVMTKSLCPEGT